MSFPVRILKQWRVDHIHISLCQLGEIRRIIKSTVTDKGNMEIGSRYRHTPAQTLVQLQQL